MQKNCVAKGCKSSEEESRDVSFFKFPHHDADLLESWRQAVGRHGWYPALNSQLCSKHFAADSFIPGWERMLQPGAVPTISMTNQEVDMMDLEYEQFMSNEEYEEVDEDDMLSEDSNLEDYCRVCATQGFGKLYPIFSRLGEKWRIVEKISSCLPINVSQTDRISLHICAGCLRKLDASYEFIISALESDASFQEKFPSDWWNKARVPFMDYDSDDDDSDGHPLVHEEFVVVKKEEEEEVEESVEDHRIGEEEAGFGLVDSCGRPLQIDGPATCDICSCTFTNMNAFDNHIMREHRLGHRWPCSLCDLGFDDPSDLLAHKVTMHIDEMASCAKCSQMSGFRCHVCDCEFATAAETREHCLAHATLVCKVCGVQCASFEQLTQHCTEHLTKRHVCGLCGQTFSGRLSLSNHQRSNCNKYKKPFTYLLCNKGFNYLTNLQDHLQTHSDQQPMALECKQCELTFETATDKEQHDKTHVSDMTCVTCNKTFSNEVVFRKHRNLHDPSCWDQFRCKVCQRPCRDAEALCNHTALHTGNKLHTCDMCGRTYNRYANMLKHRKQHKPRALWKHRCEHCDSMFEQQRDLAAHLQTVHGITAAASDASKKKSAVKWVCRFCGKVISTKLSLQDHERIHTGAKPFVCEWCGREFRSRPNLLQHHLTHTGDRRHACGICGKRFSRKSFITQHMRVHTGEKPFVCDICGHRFTQAGDMRRHRKRHIEAQEEVAVVLQLDPLQ